MKTYAEMLATLDENSFSKVILKPSNKGTLRRPGKHISMKPNYSEMTIAAQNEYVDFFRKFKELPFEEREKALRERNGGLAFILAAETGNDEIFSILLNQKYIQEIINTPYYRSLISSAMAMTEKHAPETLFHGISVHCFNINCINRPLTHGQLALGYSVLALSRNPRNIFCYNMLLHALEIPDSKETKEFKETTATSVARKGEIKLTDAEIKAKEDAAAQFKEYCKPILCKKSHEFGLNSTKDLVIIFSENTHREIVTRYLSRISAQTNAFKIRSGENAFRSRKSGTILPGIVIEEIDLEKLVPLKSILISVKFDQKKLENSSQISENSSKPADRGDSKSDAERVITSPAFPSPKPLRFTGGKEGSLALKDPRSGEDLAISVPLYVFDEEPTEEPSDSVGKSLGINT